MAYSFKIFTIPSPSDKKFFVAYTNLENPQSPWASAADHIAAGNSTSDPLSKEEITEKLRAEEGLSHAQIDKLLNDAPVCP
jgi:hypothetical protein